MCGIVGYIGHRQAAPVLLEGLAKLEYRGYDSAGIAVRDGDGVPVIVKAKGRLRELCERTDEGRAVIGSCGIGHTRWATHGEPSEANAHPHSSDSEDVVAVHNGIIENYTELREKLIKKGYTFYSQTDTEVCVKLVDYYYKKYKMGPIDAIAKTMVRVRGSYALAVMFRDYPGEVYAARRESPLIIGVNSEEGEGYIASDVPAILKFTRDVHYVDNLQMVKLTAGAARFYNLDGEEVDNAVTRIEWNAEAAEKGGFEHFMMKEIHEQPTAVSDTLSSCIHDGLVDLGNAGLDEAILKGFKNIHIVACGSAFHVGSTLQYVLEDLAKLPVKCELASEFRYRNLYLPQDSLVIAISQSGETADTLAAMRKAAGAGIKTMAIVNVVGSSLAREADYCLYTLAGPEISVATTKAYSAQLAAGYAFSVALAAARGTIDAELYGNLVNELLSLPEKIKRILEDKERLQWFSSKFSNVKDVFFLGRGLDYTCALEGSLKLKEISYIHSEAYAAGEMKHGTISLVEDGTMIIGILTQGGLFEKMVSNLVEVKTRGAYLMGLTTYGNYSIEDTTDFTVYIPRTDERFLTSLAIIPLQLLGYYVSVGRGLDVDKPRNLAKSVTVE